MRTPALLFAALLLAACQQAEPPPEPEPEPRVAETAPEPPASQPTAEPGEPETDRLAEVLEAQPDEVQQRYDERHPQATLSFFGIEPGMTVVEALPGGGWYTRILLPYLGADGRLIGANYPLDLWPNFEFASEEFLADIQDWVETFPSDAAMWCDRSCADVDAFWLGSLPDEMQGTADAVLFIRALHNLARFQNAGVDDYLDEALADAFAALAPGGVLGIVQHEARADMPDDWADGSNGYLKKSFVVEKAEAAGFVLEAESDVNANPDDRPTADDYVWRLPPSLSVPDDAEDPEALRAEYTAIGESNRMTLRFRKPARPAADD